jgi:hypothetical protein
VTRPTHPTGGFAHYGCRCAGCVDKPRRVSARLTDAQRRALEALVAAKSTRNGIAVVSNRTEVFDHQAFIESRTASRLTTMGLATRHLCWIYGDETIWKVAITPAGRAALRANVDTSAR